MLRNDLINLVNNFFIQEFNLPFEQPRIPSDKSLLFIREIDNYKVYLEYFFDEQDSNNDQIVCYLKFKRTKDNLLGLNNPNLTDITQVLNNLKIVVEILRMPSCF